MSNLRYLLDAIIQRDGVSPVQALRDLVFASQARLDELETAFNAQDFATYLTKASGTPAGSFTRLAWENNILQLLAPITGTLVPKIQIGVTGGSYATLEQSRDGTATTLRNTASNGTINLATTGGGVSVTSNGTLIAPTVVLGGNSIASFINALYGWETVLSSSSLSPAFTLNAGATPYITMGGVADTPTATARGLTIGDAYLRLANQTKKLDVQCSQLTLNGVPVLTQNSTDDWKYFYGTYSHARVWDGSSLTASAPASIGQAIGWKWADAYPDSYYLRAALVYRAPDHTDTSDYSSHFGDLKGYITSTGDLIVYWVGNGDDFRSTSAPVTGNKYLKLLIKPVPTGAPVNSTPP